jgi:hypothetical protein
LEKRAQKRIEIGVAYTEEQVKYLQNVLTAQSKKNGAIAQLHAASLELISLCSDGKMEQVSQYLNRTISNALNQ